MRNLHQAKYGRSQASTLIVCKNKYYLLEEANGGFDPKPVKISARVPLNLSEIWIRAKNDYCQEQMLFSDGVCNMRKQNNTSFVFNFLSFLRAQPLPE